MLATALVAAAFAAGWASGDARAARSSAATTSTTFGHSRAEAQRLRALAPFVGTWYWHGQGVTVEPDGSGTASWRVYRWCDTDPAPLCDREEDHLIIGGGAAMFVLTRVDGGTATGYVITSSDPETLPVGPLSVRLRPGNHLEFPGLGAGPLCGPRARPWDCGA